MIKKIALLTLMLTALGAGTFALAYIPPGVSNCDECREYWYQRSGFGCEDATLRCHRYFECDPC